jgi:hypothetical protein
VQRSAAQCSAVQRSAAQCSAVQRSAVRNLIVGIRSQGCAVQPQCRSIELSVLSQRRLGVSCAVLWSVDSIRYYDDDKDGELSWLQWGQV